MSKARRNTEIAPAPAAKAGLRPWHYALAAGGTFLALLAVYAPAMRGPFLFDDTNLPFMAEEFAHASLRQWLIGVRPLLMLSFWANFRLSGTDSFSYHLLNVVFHMANGALLFPVVRRLLSLGGIRDQLRDLLAAFAALLFLFHPLQTESVAYVASRSEVLSVFFFFAAFAVFLYRRREGASWLVTIPVLALFGCAVSTKEHTAVLPVVLLLTDYYFNPGFTFSGARRNWRMYAAFVAGAAVAGRWVWKVLASSDTAGFAVPEFRWYEYFFTQGRAIWLYIRLFLLPFGQNVDHDLAASRTPFEHGAIAGLVALTGLAALAIVYRKRFPLASYGCLLFLLLLAPTSSVMPIMDPVAEHRMYLPFIGLTLVAAEFLGRWRVGRGTLAAALAGVLVIAGALASSRSALWASNRDLWEDSVAKSPGKYRPNFQLAFQDLSDGKCTASLDRFTRIAQMQEPDARLLMDWGLAYDCVGQLETAVARFREAAHLLPSAQVYSLIGLTLSKQGKAEEAFAALDTALRLDPKYALAYVYLGAIHGSRNEFDAAIADFRSGLALDPQNEAARAGLIKAEAMKRGR
jgi:protein O-mannosyl-transferase